VGEIACMLTLVREMTTLFQLILAALALPATFSCAYLLGLTLLSAAVPVPHGSTRRLRFDIVVPAYNEEPGIGRTVASLLKVDWPADQFRVLVVADNCTDATASVARGAGATVLERKDPTLRGKGYALAFGFGWSLDAGWASAIVVVDADAEVSPNLLEAFAARIENGAEALQAHYGILNPWASWRTQLITIAKGAFHIVRSRARERLGLSCGLRGNGWCVTHELLRKVPYQAFSLTEDLEYGIELGLAGYRVAYADEAHADAEMVSSETIARKQRQRWEQGRWQLIVSRTLPLLRAALLRRSAVCLDLALDLLVLPLSYVALNIAALTVLAALAGLKDPSARIWAWWGLACGAALFLHVMRGWQVSGMGARGLAALAHVPGFLLWKVVLLLRRKSDGWVRTEREKP
jgi:cellulose synthase/poly-beta-1,6-N-acetylglucosamine synthase-like glycosyltransferase